MPPAHIIAAVRAARAAADTPEMKSFRDAMRQHLAVDVRASLDRHRAWLVSVIASVAPEDAPHLVRNCDVSRMHLEWVELRGVLIAAWDWNAQAPVALPLTPA